MSSGKILAAELDGVYTLKFIGDVRLTLCGTIDNFFDTRLKEGLFDSVIVDLTQAEGIDSTTLGLLAKLAIHVKEKYEQMPTIVSTDSGINRILKSVGFDRIFRLLDQPLEVPGQLGELPQVHLSKDDLRKRVIAAHQTMMSLNDANREKFQDIMSVLETSG